MKRTLFFLLTFFSLSYQINASQSIKIDIAQDTCVDINFKNGKTVVAKIIKGNGREIFYQKCNSDDKKIYRISTDYVTSTVKLDAKSQMEAYGIGNKFRRTTNAIVWTGLSMLIGLISLASGSIIVSLIFLLTLIIASIGLTRVIEQKDYPYRISAFVFLIAAIIIASILGILPLFFLLFV